MTCDGCILYLIAAVQMIMYIPFYFDEFNCKECGQDIGGASGPRCYSSSKYLRRDKIEVINIFLIIITSLFIRGLLCVCLLRYDFTIVDNTQGISEMYRLLGVLCDTHRDGLNHRVPLLK